MRAFDLLELVQDRTHRRVHVQHLAPARSHGCVPVDVDALDLYSLAHNCGYSRRRGFVTSLAGLGRRARCSDFHCATDARYSSLPPRVAALRVNSRDTVEGLRPMRRAISRMPRSCARSCPISSRLANDRYLSDTGFDINNGIPPRCRNQRDPPACDTPTASAAFSLVMPVAISTQN